MPTFPPRVAPAAHAHEIWSQRRFPVPRDVLFQAFADPDVLATWWGPQGSVNAFETFDMRPGGAWTFVMRAADGREYAMTHEFLEIVVPERVVFRHLQAGHGFELHMHYDAVGAAAAELRWCMRFEDAAEATRVRAFVTAANEENFDRLAAVLGVPRERGQRDAPPAA